LPRAYR